MVTNIGIQAQGEGGSGQSTSVAPLSVTERIDISPVCLSKCTVELELCGRVDVKSMQKQCGRVYGELWPNCCISGEE